MSTFIRGKRKARRHCRRQWAFLEFAVSTEAVPPIALPNGCAVEMNDKVRSLIIIPISIPPILKPPTASPTIIVARERIPVVKVPNRAGHTG